MSVPEDVLTQTTEEVPATPSQGDVPAGAEPGAAPAPAQPKYLTEQDVDKLLARKIREDRSRRPAAESPWAQFGSQIDTHPEADTIRSEVQELINRHYNRDPAQVAQETAQSVEQRVELRLAEHELRTADPAFRQHEPEIRDWAEENGIQIRSAKDLRTATLAWKGANSTQLLAQAEVDAARKAQADAAAKRNGTLASGSTTQQAPVDYRKMKDADIVRSLGMKLPWDS